ncbi:MAG: Crp/Fnr family transcriptional regulator [Anaerolineales bacterium]|nr:Crp/Fnr family transcriptional regulator [Anaerolineales bacterium]
MNAEILPLLRANDVFKSLSEVEISEFSGLAIARKYQKGEFICLSGDLWSYLFIIAHGTIEAQKESTEGRSLLIASFSPGEIFWGPAFFDEQIPVPVTLVSRTASRIYLWSRAASQPFLLKHGALTWEIARLMTYRMLHVSEIVESLAFQPVAQRLARLLLEQFPADKTSAERHLTLDEMAARIGTTREMVCRLLYRFASQGAIQINRTEFVFKDRQLLENLK